MGSSRLHLKALPILGPPSWKILSWTEKTLQPLGLPHPIVRGLTGRKARGPQVVKGNKLCRLFFFFFSTQNFKEKKSLPLAVYFLLLLRDLWPSYPLTLSIVNTYKNKSTHLHVTISIAKISTMSPRSTFFLQMKHPQYFTFHGSSSFHHQDHLSLGENGYMYIYGWVPPLFPWNYHIIVNQLCAVFSCSVVSDSLQPHGLYPARLLCLWGFSKQEEWSGLPCLLQRIFPNLGLNPGFLHFRRFFTFWDTRKIQ